MQCGRDADGEREGCGAGAVSTIKRSDFGLTYASGLVGDDIDLSFQVTAFRVPTRCMALDAKFSYRTTNGAAARKRSIASQSQSMPRPGSDDA